MAPRRVCLTSCGTLICPPVQAVADAETASLGSAVREAQQACALMNRLTYCRLLAYQSSRIDVEAVLSARVRVLVSFTLSLDPTTGKVNERAARGVCTLRARLLTPFCAFYSPAFLPWPCVLPSRSSRWTARTWR